MIQVAVFVNECYRNIVEENLKLEMVLHWNEEKASPKIRYPLNKPTQVCLNVYMYVCACMFARMCDGRGGAGQCMERGSIFTRLIPLLNICSFISIACFYSQVFIDIPRLLSI